MLFLAGERADPDTVMWAENLLKIPENWLAEPRAYRRQSGRPRHAAGQWLGTVPMPGYDVRIVDEGRPRSAAEQDGLDRLKARWRACRRCGRPTTKCAKLLSEFPAITRQMLATRTRSSAAPTTSSTSPATGSRPAAWKCSPRTDVAECAVLGIKDDLKGEVPCGFIVLKSGVNRHPAEIEKECVALIREKIGPVAAFKLAITVTRLPKTRWEKSCAAPSKKSPTPRSTIR